MPALVRTPIQHESAAITIPLLTSFQILASPMQDYRTLLESQPRSGANMTKVLPPRGIYVENTKRIQIRG